MDVQDVQSFFDQGVSKVKGAVSSVGIEQQAFMKGFVRLCNDGWEQGWHERNGGNASYRLTAADVAACRTFFLAEPGPWVALDVRAEGLAGEYFAVTGAGKFMRNVALDPSSSIGIVEIDSAGGAYRVVWGLDGGGAPTSEFASHFMIHAVKKAVTNGAFRVLYHCHPIDLIALTCAVEADSRSMTRVLWRAMTECIMVFPEGVGAVPCLVPGSRALAEETGRLMERHNAVVWAHHGLMVSGADFDSAFGLAHVIAKAASIHRSTCALCGGPEAPYPLSDADLRGIASELGLPVDTAYFD